MYQPKHTCGGSRAKIDRENCEACVYNGYGKDKDGATNYAGWLRVDIPLGKRRPERAITSELERAKKENPAYYNAVLEDAKKHSYKLP